MLGFHSISEFPISTVTGVLTLLIQSGEQIHESSTILSTVTHIVEVLSGEQVAEASTILSTVTHIVEVLSAETEHEASNIALIINLVLSGAEQDHESQTAIAEMYGMKNPSIDRTLTRRPLERITINILAEDRILEIPVDVRTS